MIPAIVLAAGASSRMGRTKALLSLPAGDSFLIRIDATLRAAGLDQIVAVIGYDSMAIRASVERAESAETTSTPDLAGRTAPRLRLVENPDPSRGQLSSLLVGLDAVLAAHSRGGAGVPPAILVTPVDLPLVSVDTVSRVIAAWRSSRAPIVRPAHAGRHGHPVIFGAAVFAELRAADLRVGARAIVRAHHEDLLDVPVDDPGAFEDIDTPEDYARIVDGRP